MKKILSIIAGIAITLSANAEQKIMPTESMPTAAIAIENVKATSITQTAAGVMDAISVDKPGNTTLANIGGYVTNSEGDLLFGGAAGALVWVSDNVDRLLRETIYQYGGSHQTNVAYEPYTNTLFTFCFSRNGVDANLVNKQLILAYSQDMGQTWNSYVMYDATEERDYNNGIVHEFYHPSISVSNASQSNNFADIRVAYRVWQSSNEVAGIRPDFKTSLFGFVSGEDILNGVPTGNEIEQATPWEGSNLQKLYRYNLKGQSAIVDGKPWAYFYGTTDPPEGSTDTKSDFTMVGIDMSEMAAAEQLLGSGIGKSATEINAHIADNSVSGGSEVLEVDANGNVYVSILTGAPGVPEGTYNQALPKIFKASDNGRSSFQLIDSMPAEVMTNFLISINAQLDGLPPDLDSPWSFIATWGNSSTSNYFTVLGEDEYSLVFPIYYYVLYNGESQRLHSLIECVKQNGQWSIKMIDQYLLHTGGINSPGFSDANSAATSESAPFSIDIDTAKGGHGVYLYGSHYINVNSSEIQLAKTADSQYLVAKYRKAYESTNASDPKNQIEGWDGASQSFYWWVDRTTDIGTQTHQRGEATTNTFPYANVFLSYRPIAGGDWSEPVPAIYCDTLNTTLTAMPTIVPDLENIPIFFMRTRPRPDQAPGTAGYYFNNLPAVLRSSAVGFEYLYGSFGIANATDVTKNMFFGGNKTGIKEGDASGMFMLGDVSPNPVTTKANFEFSLAAPAFTTLKIYNALGQVIAELANGFLPAKHHYVDYNTSNLPVGTYYYTLTTGSKSETKMFNVAR